MDYFKRTKIKDILAGKKVQQEVIILGCVRTKRVSKNVAFLEINDGSSLQNIQIVFAPPEDFPQLENILTGSSIRAEGQVVAIKDRRQAFEIQGRALDLVGAAPLDYPLQKKRHSFEYLREIAHLRPRTNTFGVVNRFRSKLTFGIHKYFHDLGFYYVHTPIISTSDCEGAGDMFQVTTLDLAQLAQQKTTVDYDQDFFAEKAGLTVSGQLEAELLCAALGDVYTFGPTFRAENSNTSRHLSEFWMIEPEMAFCDLDETVVLAEDFLKFIIRYSLSECREEMDFFNLRIDKERRQLLETVAEARFTKITYTEAVEILEKSKYQFDYPVKWGLDLQSEHERFLTEKYFKRPVIVTDYPKDIKAFYMRLNSDQKTVGAMDVLVPGVGEIVGGSQREERYNVLIENMRYHNIDPQQLEWFLDIRRYGTMPHSGFGLGFERMLMYLSGLTNIRDVIAFPRTPRHARF